MLILRLWTGLLPWADRLNRPLGDVGRAVPVVEWPDRVLSSCKPPASQNRLE